MNARRRAFLSALVERVHALKSELEDVYEAEQGSLDALPDSLRNSSRGDALEDSAQCLADAVQLLDDFIEKIEEAAQ